MGTYTAELVVDDGTVDSAPATITVTVEKVNVAPVADADPDQDVSTGVSVTLDGTGSSEANGDSPRYAWALDVAPSGTFATLDDASAAQPSSIPDVDGGYVFSLIASDGSVNSSSDAVTITASTPNSVPNANAGGDQRAARTFSRRTISFRRCNSPGDGDIDRAPRGRGG